VDRRRREVGRNGIGGKKERRVKGRGREKGGKSREERKG